MGNEVGVGEVDELVDLSSLEVGVTTEAGAAESGEVPGDGGALDEGAFRGL